MARPPVLPVITRNVLPGEGWRLGKWKVRRTITAYDSWRTGHKTIAVVPAGKTVTAMEGLSLVSKPDLISATAPIPELGLVPGDTLLRYLYRGEGWADFWAKGRWYSNLDGSFMRNADGTGCQSTCAARESEPGRRTWWLQVRLPDGRTGWTNAFDSINPN